MPAASCSSAHISRRASDDATHDEELEEEEEEEVEEPCPTPMRRDSSCGARPTVARGSASAEDGLSDPAGYSLQAVHVVAVRGDTWLAALGTECAGCYDDFAFGLWRSDDGGATWAELDDVEGLDDIELPNSDVLPVVVATDDGFLAFGRAEVFERDEDEGQLFRVWRSDDGQRWEEVGSGEAAAAESHFSDSIDAATVTDDAVIVLYAAGNGLVVLTLNRECAYGSGATATSAATALYAASAGPELVGPQEVRHDPQHPLHERSSECIPTR